MTQNEPNSNQANIRPSFTSIEHTPRLALKLSVLEYCVADSIYHLSANPDYGWCYMTRTTMAEFLGVSKTTIINIIAKLEKDGIIERHPQTKHLRTTAKWYNTVVVMKEERKKVFHNREDGQKTVPTVQDVTNGQETGPDGQKTVPSGQETGLTDGQETVPNIYKGDTDKNKNNNRDKEQRKDVIDPDRILSSEQYEAYLHFIANYNRITGKKYKGDKDSKHHFKEIYSTYDEEDMCQAIQNLNKSKFHKAYASPEFISRAAQYQRWANMTAEDVDMLNSKVDRENGIKKLANAFHSQTSKYSTYIDEALANIAT